MTCDACACTGCERIPKTHRITDKGLRTAIFYTRLYNRSLRTGLAIVSPAAINPELPIAKSICAAACAVVDTIDEALLAHVREISAQLAAGLSSFGEVRGLGLLLAVELDRPAAPVVEAALDLGLVIGSAGEQTLRLTPPLTLTADEAAHGLEMLKGALA